MRKLGKTFSAKYNFKRLLQTTPDLSKRYKQHDDAINSVVPVKHISLIDYNGPILCPTTPAVGPNDTMNMEIFGPGQEDWPRRVKYAEQIPALKDQNYVVWVVKVCEMSNRPLRKPWIRVEVTRVARPTVVTYWPDHKKSTIPTASHQPVKLEKLTHIDEQKFAAYYLSDDNDQLQQHELQHCGIIPNQHLNFNATFYDHDVANLYADSIRCRLIHGAQI